MQKVVLIILLGEEWPYWRGVRAPADPGILYGYHLQLRLVLAEVWDLVAS